MSFCPICKGSHPSEVSCTDTLGRMGLKNIEKRKKSKEELKALEKNANWAMLKIVVPGLILFSIGVFLAQWVDYRKHDGRFTDYYGNGQLEYEAFIQNGKAEGVVKKYYQNGQLAVEAFFKKGKLDGMKKEYYKNGQLKLDGIFKDKKPDGLLREYYESGQLKLEGVYKHGEPVGTIKKYDENGKLKGA